jgi:hypothetical protein
MMAVRAGGQPAEQHRGAEESDQGTSQPESHEVSFRGVEDAIVAGVRARVLAPPYRRVSFLFARPTRVKPAPRRLG